VAIIKVTQLPPRAWPISRVRTLSLYGIWTNGILAGAIDGAAGLASAGSALL